MEISKKSSADRDDNEEISLKELILKIKEWISYLWRKKFLVIAIGLVGAGLGLWYSYITDPVYSAELTFVVEDSKSSPLGAYAGIASQFGIDLGGIGGSSGAFSGDNILGLLKSRLLIEKALLSGQAVYRGKKMSLADLYIEYNELKDKWKNKLALETMHFPIGADRTLFTLQQDSILNVFQNALSEKNLKVEKPDKKLSFISVTCNSTNEMFAKLFTEKLVAVALDLYIDTKTQRNKINVDRLQQQADSLEGMLNKKTYSAAQAQDLNTNPARQLASVGVELALRDKMVLQTMYAEVIKNLELSKLAMAQETPVIQVVDTPILPLDKKKFGRLKGLILGGFLGGFLTVIALIIRKVYREIMQ